MYGQVDSREASPLDKTDSKTAAFALPSLQCIPMVVVELPCQQ